MPIPEEQRAEWLRRLDQAPDETVTAIGNAVAADLASLGPTQVLRIGTRTLRGPAAQTFVFTLLRSNDRVEKSDLAKQYIETGRIDEAPAEEPGPGQGGHDLSR
jgi:hypothetical protein